MGAEEERRGETVGVGVLNEAIAKMEGKKSCRRTPPLWRAVPSVRDSLDLKFLVKGLLGG
jgi:hypothetical protein